MANIDKKFRDWYTLSSFAILQGNVVIFWMYVANSACILLEA